MAIIDSTKARKTFAQYYVSWVMMAYIIFC